MDRFKLFVKASLREHDENCLGEMSVPDVAARIGMPTEEAHEHLARMFREDLAYRVSRWRDNFLLKLSENGIALARLKVLR